MKIPIYIKWNETMSAEDVVGTIDKIIATSRENKHNIRLLIDECNLKDFISCWPVSYFVSCTGESEKPEITNEEMLAEQVVSIGGLKVPVETVLCI